MIQKFVKKVFVNGYGSIGSRITQFIADDSDIELVGVGKYSPDDKVRDALSRGFNVYLFCKEGCRKGDLFELSL